MKEVYSEKLKKSLSINKRLLIIAIVLLLALIGSILWAVKEFNTEPTPTHLNTVIVDQNNKTNVYSCVTISNIPYVFAETSTNKFEDKYYFVRDEDYFYIAFLDYNTFAKLNKDDIEKNPIEICGVTKKTTNEIRDIGIEVYNEAMEEEIVTKENFNDYFGEIYLDVTASISDDSIAVLVAILLGSFTIVVIPIVIMNKVRTNKAIKNISMEEWAKINNEAEDPNTIYYEKAKLYLTKNYIMDFSHGMTIIKYSDVLWMYPFELRQYGITTTKNIVIVDKNFKKHSIAGINNFGKAKEQFDNVLNTIMEHNKDILLGFTKENQNKVKELKKQTKK